MGAWGTAPFDNDDAADWRYLLVDGGDIGVVQAALRALLGPDAPQGPDDSAAVAAASIMAAALDGDEDDLPDDVSDWLATHRGDLWPELAPGAIQALDRVAADSELRDLWSEAEDDDWATGLTELRQQIVDGMAGDASLLR